MMNFLKRFNESDFWRCTWKAAGWSFGLLLGVGLMVMAIQAIAWVEGDVSAFDRIVATRDGIIAGCVADGHPEWRCRIWESEGF